MRRISGAGHVNNLFVNETATKPPTEVTADWLNTIQEELVAIVLAAGIELDNADNTQVLQAINHHITEAIGNINIQLPDAIPAGAVAPFARQSVPTGWLECSGGTFSRTSYGDLFAVIGTQFGAGNGSTTFRIPDLRGEFLRGWDHGRGLDSGRLFGSVQSQNTNKEIISMGTQVNGTSPIHAINEGSSGSAWLTTGRDDGASRSIRLHMSNTETRPRNVALMFCIKY